MQEQEKHTVTEQSSENMRDTLSQQHLDPLQKPTKSASIFSDFQNAEQSHETYISNQIREQLVQLGLSKEDIESKYEKYIPATARAIIEKSNEQAEALRSLYRRLVNEGEGAAAEIFRVAKTSNQDDVTLEQEPNKKGGNHSIGSLHTKTGSAPLDSILAADPDLDSQAAINPTLSEIGDTESVPRSYVAETITEEEQIKIGDALVAATALTTNKYRLNESLSDISAAFCKLARVLDVKCGENEDYYLVLFEIWRNLAEN